MIQKRKRDNLYQEEILVDSLSSQVTLLENVGRYYIKCEPGITEGYIYRIDLFDRNCGGWYHSEWYDKNGKSIRVEYYED